MKNLKRSLIYLITICCFYSAYSQSGSPLLFEFKLGHYGKTCDSVSKPIANYPFSVEFGDSIRYLFYTDQNGMFYDTIYTPLNSQSGFNALYPMSIHYLDSSNVGDDRLVSLIRGSNGAFTPNSFMSIEDRAYSPYKNLNNCNDLEIYTETYMNDPKKVKFHHTYAQYDHNLIWNFGDGNTSDEMFPIHFYATTGTYIYSLSIGNCNVVTDTVVIHAQNQVSCPTSLNYTFLENGKAIMFSSDLLGFDPSPVWTIGNDTRTRQRPAYWNFNGKKTAYSYQAYGCGVIWDTIYPQSRCFAKFEKEYSKGKTWIIPTVYDPNLIYEWTYRDGSGNAVSDTIKHSGFILGKFESGFTQNVLYQTRLTVYDSISNCSDSECKEVLAQIKDCMADFYIDSANSGNGNVVIINNSFTNNGNATYYWDFGDSTFSTSPYPTHVYANSGRYHLNLIVTNGNCIDTASLWLGVDSVGNLYKRSTQGFTLNIISPDEISLPEENLLESIIVYPNPGAGLFYLNEIAKGIIVYDIRGRKIWESKAETDQVGLQNFENGIYIFSIEGFTGQKTQIKVIKN